MKVGILHPGEMGSVVAASVRNTLGSAFWCSQGRGMATRTRAETLGLGEIATLEEFCSCSDLIVSVCPPHAAREQARAVIATGYRGLYLEANAIAPATVRRIANDLENTGISCVDGGIIGLPTSKRGTTWLHLSGPRAAEVASCFAAGPLETSILGTDIGQASALKLCYAAWNKGSTALLAATLAAAEANGVRSALERQWEAHEAGFPARGAQRLRGVARKAWRFGGEMEEIARFLRDSSLPGDFFDAAAELYARLQDCKDAQQAPALEELLALLLDRGRQDS